MLTNTMQIKSLIDGTKYVNKKKFDINEDILAK